MVAGETMDPVKLSGTPLMTVVFVTPLFFETIVVVFDVASTVTVVTVLP